MTILTAPTGPLTDGVVVLRLPSPDTGDVATVNGYIQDEQLDGGWLPEVPLLTGEQLVADWLDGWAGRHSRHGPAFVVTVPDEQRFVGVVGMLGRDDGAIEMFYGTAPGWRGKGLASRATRLAAQWVARQPSVRTVEARMDQGERASERVAVNAGFVLAETLHQSDPDNPDTAVELRYIMARPGFPESKSGD
jgi:ribosomal-protein-serine acetyltransferase